MALGPEMSRRRLAVLGLTCSAIALAAGQARAARSELEIRQRRIALAAAEFYTEGGERRTIADFRGRGLVINLWATWCPPCVEEMPALDRLAKLIATDRIEVLALSQDRGGGPVVRAFYDRHALRHLGVWLDPRGAAARSWGVRGLPTTIIVDRAGMESARVEGAASWDAPHMVAKLRSLVEPHEAATAAT
ncbi:MAG: TlpA family protein disulfide reductase [Elioraea sp.]|nr:TlpA family protein disulfide reductase [Elioraea sp.]